MKFSVIIPVYNAEKTLNRCLDSIVNQSFKDYEIILVNDGSVDNSESICLEYTNKYDNIKYEHKINGGASSARNKGIELAKGDFILFVDCDDFVEDNYFATLSNNCVKNGLAVFTYMWLKTSGAKKREITDYANDDFFNVSKYLVLSRTINSPCSKIFDRAVIENNNLRFDEKMPVAEDFIFCLKYLMLSDRVEIHNDSIYCYDMTNEDSLVNKRKKGLIDIYPYVFNSAFEIIDNTDFSDNEKSELFKLIDKLHTDSFVTCVMEELKDDALSPSQIKRNIRLMCDKFYTEFSTVYGYENFIHRFVRFCIKHKCANILYYASKIYSVLRK